MELWFHKVMKEINVHLKGDHCNSLYYCRHCRVPRLDLNAPNIFILCD